MNKDEIRREIEKIVNSSSGIKNVDLALKILDKSQPQYFDQNDYHAALEELLAEDKIMELAFIIPNMDGKNKYIYFPKGTTIIRRK